MTAASRVGAPGAPLVVIVNPNTTRSMTATVVEHARRVAQPSTELVGFTASQGVPSIETNEDEVYGALAVVEQIRRGEAAGASGYVIACFGDTGVAAAKEVATGPVVGMTEAALLTATTIASRAAIVTLPVRTREQSRRVLRAIGMEHRISVRAIEQPVSDVHSGSLHLLDAIAKEAEAAMRDDGAEAIVLGCAGLADLQEPLAARLGAPVIEGVAAAVTMVEGLLAQGLSTSRVATFARSGGAVPSSDVTAVQQTLRMTSATSSGAPA
jgi:allantoin racemase